MWHKHEPETPAAQLTAAFHPIKPNTSAEAAQHGLTEGLQAGLDELLPACPLGEGTQGHHGFTRGGLGRAGFVEPVRTAWRRNSRPGAASWSHSPWETPTKEEWGGRGGTGGLAVSLSAHEDAEYVCVHVFQTTILCDYGSVGYTWNSLCNCDKKLEPLFRLKNPPPGFWFCYSLFSFPSFNLGGNTGWLRTSSLNCWVTSKQEGICLKHAV